MRLLGRVFGGTLVVVLVSIIVPLLVSALLFLDDAPALDVNETPSPSDVIETRILVQDLRRSFAGGLSNRTPLIATTNRLNSALRVGSRFVPGLRSSIVSDGDALVARASLPISWLGGTNWINLTATVPEFQDQLEFEQVTLGGWSVPPRLIVPLGRRTVNIMFGDNTGDTLLSAAKAMLVDGETVQVDLALAAMGENGLMRNVFGAIRGRDFPSAVAIDAAYTRIRSAMDDGILPDTGTLAPYLQFALRDALEVSSNEDPLNAFTAAMFALTRVCGPENFAIVVGRLAIAASGPDGDWTTDCDDITLNNRIDSRRHFIASAAIRAAANRGVSYSIGEFKELHDIASGAGGFDFTDIAANASGIRLSDYFMALPRQDWDTKIDQLSNQRAFIIAFDGIPQLMPEADFNARFGNVDSADYKDMLSVIETRIDQLDLYD